ncbi:protein timeless-like isoform X2 [Daphnia carinata]|uniref:protein timeless-like isoform X2 n=1 Tax=Daphnia carinata TaxID=120202 RepID=UPI002580F137|nr:protein timeless-like isoform X2 [Daphnia carinata]
MDWMALTVGFPCLSLLPLGTFYRDKYYISDECLACLKKMNAKINCEDPNTRALRRALIFMDILNKDLIPILVQVNQPSIIRSTVELLTWLTVPVSCLIPTNAMPDDISMPKFMVYEFTQFLYNAKDAFLDPKVTQAVVDQLSFCLTNPLTTRDCEFINYLLLLIRNVLYAPERPFNSTKTEEWMHPMGHDTGTNGSQQRRLIWVLFAQGFDQILLSLLTYSQKGKWVVTIVQLIALLYQGHPAEIMEKLLDRRAYTACSSTNDDPNDGAIASPSAAEDTGLRFANYSETSRKDEPSVLTRVDDRNGINVECIVKGKEEQKLKGTNHKQKENKGSESHHIQTKIIRNPSEEDVSQLLVEFIPIFLQNGFNALVNELHQKLIQQDVLLHSEKSFFLWLITYFMRFASQLKLDAKCLKNIFVIDLLCHLTWDAIHQTEEFEVNSLQPSLDLTPFMRRLHLGITAIGEYLRALDAYCTLAESKQTKIFQLRDYLLVISDLRQLFLLRLRLFNPNNQGRRYLCEIIKANHILLLSLERAIKQSASEKSFDISEHLKQFCCRTIIDRYGTALRDFKTNGSFVNDCIFTVLHHVGIDLGQVDLLCDPVILRNFSQIWASEFKLCENWQDLIEYVVRKFMRDHQTKTGCFYEGSPPRTPDQDKQIPFDAQRESTACKSPSFIEAELAELQILKTQLVASGYQQKLRWIQKSLLVACSARLGTYVNEEFRNLVACLSLQMRLPCPIIPWTVDEASALNSSLFRLLLLRMGLQTSVTQTARFPRIPFAWSAESLFRAALVLGPVDSQDIDFDLQRITKVEPPVPPCHANSPDDD